jgi:Tol biopolymer transport system component
MIQECGVNNFRQMGKKLEISEDLIKIIIESLKEKGYLKAIEEVKYEEEMPFACKFCPFAHECSNSERMPTVFYELSQKGKNLLDNYKTR